MGARGRSEASLWRVAIPFALSVLAPSTAGAGPTPVAELQARFPAIRARFSSEVRFEAVSWRNGSRVVRGFRAQAAAGVRTPAPDRARVDFPAVATDPFVVEGEGVRVVLRPLGARGARAQREPGALLYRGAYAETDAWHVPTSEWTEEHLHLRSRRAPRRFVYEVLATAGATRVALDGGQVRFLAPDGRGLVILAPVVVDATGRRSSTAARWKLEPPSPAGTRRLTLQLDPAGLEYPLLVDPSWTTTGSMATGRYDPIGILLQTGKVLVMGGWPPAQATAELYDPATGAWSATSPLGGPGRSAHAAVLLRDGRALMCGGLTSLAETADCRTYSPLTGTWTATAPLPSIRQHHTLTLLNDGRVLVAGGADNASVPLASTALYDPLANTWTSSGPLNVPRSRHVAVLLGDGRVLVAGGLAAGLLETPTSEIWSPATGIWTPAGNMQLPRTFFSATRLPDGRVLALGDMGLADLFDPGTGNWTPAAPTASRGYHTATLLPRGRVLVAGGWDSAFLASTELYDPTGGTWSSGPAMATGRRRHSATLLPDGRVLVAGGQPGGLTTAELLDVDVPAWSADLPLTASRSEPTLTLLKDGRTLLAGGAGLDTAETRDPATGAWSATANAMRAQRWRHTATLLGDGHVLVTGSAESIAAGQSADIYSPTTNTWNSTTSMSGDRSWHTATLLPCGEVLVVGGQSFGGTSLASAERYNPRTKRWRPTASLGTGRWKHTATLLDDGRVLVTGGFNGGSLPNAEIYDPSAETWTPAAGTMTVGRYHHTATLLPGGRVLIAGGLGTAGTAELFNPATTTFAPTGPPTVPLDTGTTATLLPNGRVLAVGGAGAPTASSLYDPAVGVWTVGPALTPSRDTHAAALLLDGRVLVAGGAGGSGSTSALFTVGRGEATAWRPVTSTLTEPLLRGSSFVVTGTGFKGLGEGSTGFGSQQSAANYPLVQLRRLDNGATRFVAVASALGWTDTSFNSIPLTGFAHGPALVTVFTNGIPGVSRAVFVECPAPSISSSPASQSVCAGDTVSFAVTALVAGPDCPAYQWRKNGTALADAGPFSGTATSTLTITGASASEADTYDLEVSLACSHTTAVSSAATLAVTPSLSAVNASISGPNSVCATCLGGTASESHTGGGPVSHQWGYRTTSGGAITDIPGATSPTYTLSGTDFPGPGSYFLVVRVAPACGATRVSNESGVSVTNAPPPGDEVPFLTVTSRDQTNLLEWVYPAGYTTVRIHATAGSPCVFPNDPLSLVTLLAEKTGAGGASDRHAHFFLTNDTTYCYTVFVDKGGGTWSTGRRISGRPVRHGVRELPGRVGVQLGDLLDRPPDRGRGRRPCREQRGRAARHDPRDGGDRRGVAAGMEAGASRGRRPGALADRADHRGEREPRGLPRRAGRQRVRRRREHRRRRSRPLGAAVDRRHRAGGAGRHVHRLRRGAQRPLRRHARRGRRQRPGGPRPGERQRDRAVRRRRAGGAHRRHQRHGHRGLRPKAGLLRERRAGRGQRQHPVVRRDRRPAEPRLQAAPLGPPARADHEQPGRPRRPCLRGERPGHALLDPRDGRSRAGPHGLHRERRGQGLHLPGPHVAGHLLLDRQPGEGGDRHPHVLLPEMQLRRRRARPLARPLRGRSRQGVLRRQRREALRARPRDLRGSEVDRPGRRRRHGRGSLVRPRERPRPRRDGGRHLLRHPGAAAVRKRPSCRSPDTSPIPRRDTPEKGRQASSWFRPHEGLRGATPAEAFLGTTPAHHAAVEPPRGRPGEGPAQAPFEIDYLDPAKRRFPLLRRAA